VPRRLLHAWTAAAAVTAAVLVTSGGQAVAADASPATPPPTACAPVIRIDSMLFEPGQVTPGGSSQAVLTLTNCSGVTQQVDETWTGRWLWTSKSGQAGFCPAIDPLAWHVGIGPYAQASSGTGYTVPAGCGADVLRVTATLRVAGTQVGQGSADLIVDQPSAG